MSEIIEQTNEMKVAGRAAEAIMSAINNAANGTGRSRQQAEMILGVSNVGHCRQYAALMVKQVPFSDERPKVAAFIGTVLGSAIEDQLKREHPGWLFQQDLVVSIPAVGDAVWQGAVELDGHPDVIIPASAATEEFPQGVWDLKSKDGLEVVKRLGQTLQQKFQIAQYAKAAIDKGLLDPTKPIYMGDVYYDRAGSSKEAYALFELYDEDLIRQVGEWLADVKYAVVHNVDAERDQSREFCANWCEYYTTCRGADTDVTGLIEDPEILTAVDVYVEGRKLASEGDRMKRDAQKILSNVSGSTGVWNVRAVQVAPTEIAAYTRAGYTRVDVRAIPAPKPPRKRKPQEES